MLNYLSNGLLAPSLGALILITLVMTHITIVGVRFNDLVSSFNRIMGDE
ncbi:MAG: hypothetical protein ACPHM2_01220 [Alcanivorax sp.]